MAEARWTLRRALGALAALGLGLAAVLAVPALTAPAAAGEGMEVLCSDAGYRCVEDAGYRGQSRWGANYFEVGHNCTSYVSWVLSEAGAEAPWYPMGNANLWDDRGQGRVPVDDVPAAGAVAQWDEGTRLAPGAAGHVAIVDVVTAGYIEVSDDTGAGLTRRIRIHRGSPYWPTAFVHIKDRIPVPVLASIVWIEVVGAKLRAAALTAAPSRSFLARIV
jgi:surface antigen